MYRVLHVIRSLDPALGGPVNGLRTFVAEYPNLGWTADVATADAPGKSWEKLVNATVFALGPGKGTYGYTKALGSWLNSHAKDYDTIIVEGLWQYTGLATRRAALVSGVPYFVFAHGMLSPWFKKTYPLKHLKKLAYWPWGEYRILHDARAVLFTTEEEKIAARDSFRLYRCNEEVIGYGCAGPPHLYRQEFESRFPETVSKRNLLFLGRIHPVKGCDLLLEAFSRVASAHPDAHLTVAGPDQMGWGTELRGMARLLGLDSRVSWTGNLKDELKWGALQAADALVLPSHHESFSVVAVEALSCGIPVLLSDKVNIWRQIVRSGAGLAETDSVAGTAALMGRWLEMSTAEKLVFRNAAQQCFTETFAIAIATRRLTQFMESCLA